MTLPTVQELRALVKRRRKAGDSLRAIDTATGLRLRTVRSILAGANRTSELRKREVDRLRAAALGRIAGGAS